jgi:hypothetical protein
VTSITRLAMSAWITIVEPQCQAHKLNCFVALDLRIYSNFVICLFGLSEAFEQITTIEATTSKSRLALERAIATCCWV